MSQYDDDAPDHAAIRETITREKEAFCRRDYEAWAACFVHDDRTEDIACTQTRGILIHRGWDAAAAAMKTLMEDNPEPETLPFRDFDFNITVRGDVAWATYYSEFRVREDARFRSPDVYETRILEKVGGRWLIVYTNFAILRYARLSTSLVQVDREGKVLWASNATLAALEDFEGLTLSNNRLRARTPAYDKELREAIGVMAGHVHLFSSDLRTRTGGRAAIPCFLGEGRNGEVLTCLVFARNGEINVVFGEHDMARQRVQLTSESFGLSEAQTRSALALTAGLSIAEGAKQMGISVNTFRTHLARIYDKTGAKSKTDLVRLMLSVGDPGR